MNTRSTGIDVIGVPGFRPMYSKAAADGLAIGRVGEVGRIGHAAADVASLGPGWCPR